MTMIDSGSTDGVATSIYAHLFQALADPSRLVVLQHLSTGPHRVRDLVEHLDLAQSTVSKHLGFLLECNLVSIRPEGRSTWYSLAHPHETGALVRAAESLLLATGSHAVLSDHLRQPQHREDA